MEWRLELVQVPVSDVDRAKAFYTDQAGFNADHDHQVSDELRFVQLTPPGSPASIAIGTGITDMAPGAVQGLQMVVADIDAARAAMPELIATAASMTIQASVRYSSKNACRTSFRRPSTAFASAI